MKGMKTGGRKKGTPNKDNPLKGFIRAHSLSYFEPKNVKFHGKTTIMSDFELDTAELAGRPCECRTALAGVPHTEDESR